MFLGENWLIPLMFLLQAPKKAKRRQAAGDGGSSNVFSMFEQSQIQEYKEVRLSGCTATLHPYSSIIRG